LDSKYADSIKLEDSKLTLNLEGTESITFYLMASSQSGNKAFLKIIVIGSSDVEKIVKNYPSFESEIPKSITVDASTATSL